MSGPPSAIQVLQLESELQQLRDAQGGGAYPSLPGQPAPAVQPTTPKFTSPAAEAGGNGTGAPAASVQSVAAPATGPATAPPTASDGAPYTSTPATTAAATAKPTAKAPAKTAAKKPAKPAKKKTPAKRATKRK
jgi:hypothetical protein